MPRSSKRSNRRRKNGQRRGAANRGISVRRDSAVEDASPKHDIAGRLEGCLKLLAIREEVSKDKDFPQALRLTLEPVPQERPSEAHIIEVMPS